MEKSSSLHGKVKAALFVDFDNIYSGLKNVHPKAAEEFATNPARWLAWFEQGMPTRDTDDAARLTKRALLLRHCYLNPTVFSRYRGYFTRAAFRVIDCPPLTQQNKNSTDIHMVMDILDALRHDTRFDEFILLSGDSDFTPVLLRLRLYSRQSVVLTPGPAAEAYKAASDHVVGEDIFIEEGLGLRPERVTRAVAARPSVPAPARQESAPATPATPAATPAAARDGAGSLASKILARVSELVAASPSRVSMATAAGDVIKNLGQEVLTSKWAGAGTFKKLLCSADSGRFVVDNSKPGYLYDPARRSKPATTKPAAAKPAAAKPAAVKPDAPEEWEGHPKELSAFAHRVGRVKSALLLRPEEYAVVFNALEDELREEEYFLTSTSIAVRDRCTLRGHPISHTKVSVILKGITGGGHDFNENPLANTAETFARVFREQVHKLCKSAQLDLSDEERGLLERWIRA